MAGQSARLRERGSSGPLQGKQRLWGSTGLGKAGLARRLGIPKTKVDRLFDLYHSTRLEHLDAAFHAVGKRLLIQVEEAA